CPDRHCTTSAPPDNKRASRTIRRTRPGPMPSVSPPTFAIECACGTWAHGERLSQHQVVACSCCGRPLFVYPYLPPPFSAADGSSPAGAAWAAWRERLRLWLVPAAAALIALAVVGAVIAAIVRSHRPAVSPAVPLTEGRAAQTLAAHLDAARAALVDGSYLL